MLGRVLGPYRLTSELGSGGMGKVYAATVESRPPGRVPGIEPGARVALKLVHPHLLETPGYFKRFLREAEIGRAVVHENVVRTLDTDEVVLGGVHHRFLVMEFVEGQTLRSLSAELERVPEELCRHIGREVAKGLGAIHAVGAVHRDVKPENVLITREHVVKVMDLGVARLHDDALRLSQTGAFVGSLHYAAPECFSEGGRRVDGRADLHALGLVLYELASGVNPYAADDVGQTLRRVLHEEPRRLGDVNPQVSPFFEEVVHRLLAKKPEDRFADARALLAVLEQGEDSAWWKERTGAIRAATRRPLRRIRIPRETAVHGREPDLAKLRALYDRARAGEGQVVLIEGEAGIGKSRVVDELVSRLQQGGEDLHFLSGSSPPGGAATAAGAFSTAFREQFGDAGSAAYLRQSQVLVPAFDALLRGEGAPSGVEALTRDSLQTCFVHALRSLAAERTTVLLVDDLHFAGEEARALFVSLAMAVPDHRILLVGTMRPGVDEKWVAHLTRLPHASQVSLARLGPKDLTALLRDSLGSESLALSLAGQIGQKSDGNPFFAFEILRGLRDGLFITRAANGTWVRTRVIEEIRIPSSVLDLVKARVADLTQDERDLLDAAACSGFEFDPSLIADALGALRVPLLKRLAQIERRHRLVRACGRAFVFDHHQVQEALYSSLPQLLREEYHAALAAALEARAHAADVDPAALDGALTVDLCEHFLKGTAPARALRYIAPAQAHLTAGHLHAHAASLDERVLAVPGCLAGVARARVLLHLAGALNVMGLRAREEEAAREADRLAGDAGDDEVRAEAKRALGTVLLRTSRPAEAEAAYRAALEIAASRGDRRAEAAATGRLGLLASSLGRLADAERFHLRQLDLSRETLDRAGEANATGNLGLVFKSQGRFVEAKERIERQLAFSRAAGHRRGEARAIGNLGTVLAALGRLGEAKEHYERQLALGREIGDRLGEPNATHSLGNVLSSLGRRAEAKEHHERGLALSREIGYRRGEALAMLGLAGVQLEEGDAAAGEASLLECLALVEAIAARDLIAAARLALGSLRAAAKGPESARGDLVAARDLARAAELRGVETLARCELAALPGGDAQDALAAVTAHAGRLDVEERRLASFLLWRATGDVAHLAEAKRLLDEATARQDEATRAGMLANVRLNGDIAAAAQAAGL